MSRAPETVDTSDTLFDAERPAVNRKLYEPVAVVGRPVITVHVPLEALIKPS